MKYDISKPTAPKMPRLGKGTECVKILAIAGIKRHACTTNSDAFPYTCRTCKWF